MWLLSDESSLGWLGSGGRPECGSTPIEATGPRILRPPLVTRPLPTRRFSARPERFSWTQTAGIRPLRPVPRGAKTGTVALRHQVADHALARVRCLSFMAALRFGIGKPFTSTRYPVQAEATCAPRAFTPPSEPPYLLYLFFRPRGWKWAASPPS